MAEEENGAIVEHSPHGRYVRVRVVCPVAWGVTMFRAVRGQTGRWCIQDRLQGLRYKRRDRGCVEYLVYKESTEG